MIYSDYHMHTIFADGKNTPEQMVTEALKAGLHTVGFSEHAYVPFDPDWCMSPESTEQYRREILRLKSKYDGQINILCGIEMDYDSVDDRSKYDYVIGSVHYLTVGGVNYSVDLSPQETLRCVRDAFGGDFDSYAEAYFEKVSRLKEVTGADIIGHFDLITKFCRLGAGPDIHSERYISAWRTALGCLAGEVALEINTGGMARGYTEQPYPSEDILRRWNSLGGRVVLSSDTHDDRHIAYLFDRAALLAKDCGF